MNKCEKCDQLSEFIEECGQMICSNCGEVMASHISFHSEPAPTVYFATDHISANRPFLNAMKESQISKFDKTYSFKKKQQERHKINSLLSALNMGSALREQTLDLANRFKIQGFKRKVGLNAAQIGACCYLVAVTNSYLINKSEISKLLGISEQELIKEYKRLKKVCAKNINQTQITFNKLEFIDKVICDFFDSIDKWPNKYSDPIFSEIRNLKKQKIQGDLKNLIEIIKPTCFMEGKDRFKLTKALLIIILQNHLSLKPTTQQIRQLSTYLDCTYISLYKEYLRCRNVIILLILKFLPLSEDDFVDRNFYQYLEDLIEIKEQIIQSENEKSGNNEYFDSKLCIPSFRKAILEA